MAGQTWPDKLLAHQSQAHWQRGMAGVSTCTPLSLSPTPFFLRSQGPRMGYTTDPKVGVICRILFSESQCEQQWLKGTQVRSIQNWGWNSCEDWFKWANQFRSPPTFFFFSCVLFFILTSHLVSSLGKNWGLVPSVRYTLWITLVSCVILRSYSSKSHKETYSSCTNNSLLLEKLDYRVSKISSSPFLP
jgi:hypothetical protein